MDRPDAEIRVEVVIARREGAKRCALSVQNGATLADAIVQSGLLEAGLPRDQWPKVGCYGRIMSVDAPCRDGDRIEIYRPLSVDPLDARRRRAIHKLRHRGKDKAAG